MIEQVPEHRTANMQIIDLINHVRSRSHFLLKGGGVFEGRYLSAETMKGLRSHMARELRSLRRKMRGPELDLDDLWQVGNDYYRNDDQLNEIIRREAEIKSNG